MSDPTQARVEAAIEAGYAQGDIEFATDVARLKTGGAIEGDVELTEDSIRTEIARRAASAGVAPTSVREELARRGA